MPVRNKARHRTARIAWLRAAVLDANDGIRSNSSLLLGVAAPHATRSKVLVAGVAGLVAGAMPMAVGECSITVPAAGLIPPLFSGTSLLFLALLGGLVARANGTGVMGGAMRVTFWGALAMSLTAGVGRCSEQSREQPNRTRKR